MLGHPKKKSREIIQRENFLEHDTSDPAGSLFAPKRVFDHNSAIFPSIWKIKISLKLGWANASGKFKIFFLAQNFGKKKFFAEKFAIFWPIFFSSQKIVRVPTPSIWTHFGPFETPSWPPNRPETPHFAHIDDSSENQENGPKRGIKRPKRTLKRPKTGSSLKLSNMRTIKTDVSLNVSQPRFRPFWACFGALFGFWKIRKWPKTGIKRPETTLKHPNLGLH